MQILFESRSNIFFFFLLQQEKSKAVSGWSEQENMTYFHSKTKDTDHTGLSCKHEFCLHLPFVLKQTTAVFLPLFGKENSLNSVVHLVLICS